MLANTLLKLSMATKSDLYGDRLDERSRRRSKEHGGIHEQNYYSWNAEWPHDLYLHRQLKQLQSYAHNYSGLISNQTSKQRNTYSIEESGTEMGDDKAFARPMVVNGKEKPQVGQQSDKDENAQRSLGQMPQLNVLEGPVDAQIAKGRHQQPRPDAHWRGHVNHECHQLETKKESTGYSNVTL